MSISFAPRNESVNQNDIHYSFILQTDKRSLIKANNKQIDGKNTFRQRQNKGWLSHTHTNKQTPKISQKTQKEIQIQTATTTKNPKLRHATVMLLIPVLVRVKALS